MNHSAYQSRFLRATRLVPPIVCCLFCAECRQTVIVDPSL